MGQEAANTPNAGADISIPTPAPRPADVIGSSGIAMPAGATIDQDSNAINIPVTPPAEAAEQPQPNPSDKPVEKPDKPAGSEEAANKIPDNNPDTMRKAAEKLGMDFQALTEEYSKTGNLSEESLNKAAEAMKAHGIEGGAEIIKDVINNREVTQTLLNNEFVKMAGSQDGWNEAISWAQGADAPVDVKAVFQNATQQDLTVSTALKAAQFIVDRFNQSGPVAGKRVESTAVPSTDPDLFRSQDEMAVAMADPRYRKDPAFRRAVENRIVKSMSAGTLTY